MSAKISVIIPVYNVADYLEKCLWSVTNQTFRDLEIIVVNDGSTDSSPSIINKYAEKDNRIVVINKENEGVVYARKNGIDVATGDYIHLLDGDDYIELNCYALLYEKAVESNAEIVVMRFLFETVDKKSVTESVSYKSQELSNIEFLRKIWSGEGYFCAWQYIHKRSLYENNIAFCKHLSFGEDAYLTAQLVYYSTKVVFLERPLYHYLIRENSLYNQAMSDKKASDAMLYPKLIREFMMDKPEYKKLEEHILALEVQACCILLNAHYYRGASTNCKRVVNILKQYPEITQRYGIRPLRKIFNVFASNHLAGLIYVWYHKRKG